jgi:hypothetical protein
MKKHFIVLIQLALTSIGCNERYKCDCFSENVCVTLINSTGQLVEKVNLLHEKGNAVSGQLEINAKSCLSFKSPGENSFSLIAILSNGDTIISKAVYCEGGYKFIAIVTNAKINVEINNDY